MAAEGVRAAIHSSSLRRADAPVTIAELALNSGKLPMSGGVKPHVSVVVQTDTMAGADGSPAAEAAFGATLGTTWVQRISCDAEIARIVMSPTGEVLDSGRATRTFTAAQIRAITARDKHCIWPGCDAAPGWCQAHHIVHWANGGPTSVANGALICPRHHDRVHVYGYEIDTDTGGAYMVNPYRFRTRKPLVQTHRIRR